MPGEAVVGKVDFGSGESPCEWTAWTAWRRDTALKRCSTPGLEEYIEGLSFMWYLQHGSLVSLDDVQKALSDENGEPASLPIRPMCYRLMNATS